MTQVLSQSLSKPWKLSISVSIDNLCLDHIIYSNLCCVLFIKYSSNNDVLWIPIAKTEIISEKITKINFNVQFDIYYRFEEHLHLSFKIYDIEDNPTYIDEVLPPPLLYTKQKIAFQIRPLNIPSNDYLYDLISLRNNPKQLQLLNNNEQRGLLYLSINDNSKDSLLLSCQFRGRKLPSAAAFSKQASILRILSNTPFHDNWETIISTNPIDSINPIWELLECSIRDLCDGNLNNKCIRLELEVGGKIIWDHRVSVNELVATDEYILFDNANLGTLSLIHYKFSLQHSFLDYISTGMELRLVTAIDFTASNGNPKNSTSLHYLSDKPNDYELAISKVGNLLSFYNPFRMIPVYGYGGLIPEQNTVSHCFPLNNCIEHPEVKGIQQVLEIYKQSLDNIILKGPTVFSEIIKQSISLSKDYKEQNNYLILFIITDGVIFDWRDSIDALVSSTFYPISVIIIGIGDSDFDKMITLQKDILESSAGDKARRKNIIFFPIKDLKTNIDSIPYISDIPNHIEEYYKEYYTKDSVSETHNTLKHLLINSNTPDFFNYIEAPEWISDDKSSFCYLCNNKFTFLLRKHHCRACGKLVCGNCSSNSIAIPIYDLHTPQRCCDDCYALLLRSK